MTIFLLASLSQYYFTSQGPEKILQEELAESIRNVYWLEHGYIYDGVSSNIGWYATLLFFYHSFGFSLFAGRLLRVFLHAFSILCLHRFLMRYIRSPFSEILTLLVAFSPTLVSFNSVQTSFAMDITYFPLLLLMSDTARKSKKKLFQRLLLFLLGFVGMVGAMSYPTVVFYAPSFIILFLLLKPAKQNFFFSHLIPLAAGLLLPLLLSLWYLKNPATLIYDDVLHSGIFRGGGRFVLSTQVWKDNIMALIGDLFIQGNSFYFTAKSTEFGSVMAKSAAVLFLLLSFLSFWHNRAFGKWFVPPLVMVIILCLIPAFTTGMPGIRRFTGILIVFYWVIGVHFRIVQKTGKNYVQGFSIALGVVLCALHIFSCFSNAGNLSDYNDPRKQVWFELAGTPEESVAQIKSSFVENSSIILCLKDEKGKPGQPRYAEIYAILAGDFLWNEDKEIPVYGCEYNKNQARLLRPEDWINYKWPH